VRGIATELAQKRGKTYEVTEAAAKIETSAAADSNGQGGNGGIHTNDTTTVKQYFSYYAKLANQ